VSYSYYRRKNAERESFSVAPETCPKVDKAMDDIEAALKKARDVDYNARIELRKALQGAIYEKLAMEEERDEAQQEAEALRDRVAELEAEVKSLESDLRQVSA
jgi:predicted nuclease with TOPRIM domain